MATGIFSTTRVAGEGVALAVVTALLSGFTQINLGPVAGAHAADIAQRLVTGNVAAAAGTLPSIERAAMLHAYSEAFATLLWVLTAITAATAVVVFLSLGKGADGAEEAGDEPGLVRATVIDP